MVTIKVHYEASGNPAEGAKVSVAKNGIFGWITGNEWTDAKGEAHFDVEPCDGVFTSIAAKPIKATSPVASSFTSEPHRNGKEG